MYDDGLDPDAPFSDDEWELFDVRVDPSETHDLAAEEPERLAAMIDCWWEEARRYQVLPLDNRPVAALMAPRRPFQDRPAARYFPSRASVPEENAINVRGQTHELRAHVDVPRRRARRRRAARDGHGARRMVVPPARRSTPVRVQLPRARRLRRRVRRRGPARCRTSSRCASTPGPTSPAP